MRRPGGMCGGGPAESVAGGGGLGRLGAVPLWLILERRCRSGPDDSIWRRVQLAQALEREGEHTLQWTGTCKASLMRRTLTVTTAPIFNSLRRIDPAVALAISVPAKPRRRTASIST